MSIRVVSPFPKIFTRTLRKKKIHMETKKATYTYLHVCYSQSIREISNLFGSLDNTSFQKLTEILTGLIKRVS